MMSAVRFADCIATCEPVPAIIAGLFPIVRFADSISQFLLAFSRSHETTRPVSPRRGTG
jgi:hypothetical protein